MRSNPAWPAWAEIAAAIDALRTAALARERQYAAAIAAVPAHDRPSAINLAHYLALRSHDVRPLQDWLAAAGLSSLGRCEADVLGALEALRGVLACVTGQDAANVAAVDLEDARARLARHNRELFGETTDGRPARAMATLPSDAARSDALVRRLLQAGTNIVRINCAHDSPPAWSAMIDRVHRVARELGRRCRIEADLEGPRLRTGRVVGRCDVMRFRPVKDSRGRTEQRAWIELRAAGSPGGGVAVPLDVLDRLAPGDELELRDARGRRRRWSVERDPAGRVVARCERTSYVVPGLDVSHRRGGASIGAWAIPDDLRQDGEVWLGPGDRLRMVSADSAADDNATGLPIVSCQEPVALGHLRAGERVFFDDGKIGAVIEHVDDDGVQLRVEHTRPGGGWLRRDRGINLPDSTIERPFLGGRDLEHLALLVPRVDLIGLSFVSAPQDVAEARARVVALGRPQVGLVLKIETRRAFENLPGLLFAALAHAPAGVMIARGDLAVELGFERLAEVQEEILWLCEAAHVPSIWATQVLETMARTGLPSRAEVTDAAMGARADCVMLNKGPYVVEAMRFLVGIQRRMQEHQLKKRSLLRRLAVSVSRRATS